jgi:hypothetical protein
MADVKPGEAASHAPATAPAPAPHAPHAPAVEPPPPPDPRDLAIRAAVADLERLVVESAERGDRATMERVRGTAMLLDAAIPKA